MLIKELEGKRIGYAFGSTAHHNILQALHTEGLREADVRLIPLKVSDLPDALDSGKINAFAAWEPTPTIALAKFDDFVVIHRGLASTYLYFSNTFADRYPKAVHQIVASQLRTIWVNQALERYFGLRREEIIGKDKRELILKQIKYKFEDPEAFAERVLATYDNNTYIENFESHVLAYEKCEERWLEHWSRPIRSRIYSGGRVELYYDINDRKLVEEALRESEEKYRLLIENANDAIFIAQDDIIKFPNPKAEEMTGYSAEELSEIPFVDFIHPEDRGSVHLPVELPTTLTTFFSR